MKEESGMIDLKSDADNGAAPSDEAGDDVIELPPPPSESPEASTEEKQPSRARVGLPKKPRRLPELPDERRRRPDPPRRDEKPHNNNGKILVIGHEIVLSGKIASCDRLVVEGQVEAKMKDCREIEIAETGTFKGQVEFDRADISGIFEGDLTARDHLVVRATGRVTGKVRFGELEIERGGQLVGDVQVFGEGAAEGKDAAITVDKPAK